MLIRGGHSKLDKKEYLKQWRAAHIDKCREYRRSHYARHRTEILEEQKQGRADNRERCKKWKAVNPQKVKAGSLARSVSYFEFCELCGEVHDLQKHHPDYSEPLFVVTLCRQCHKAVHVQLLKELLKTWRTF
jgi:hypothetical protein